MYPFILSLHNITRWLVLIAAVAALVVAYRGWLGRRSFTRADDRPGMIFTMLLDIQALLGLILYFFLAPSTLGLLNGTSSMASPITRYFGIEHFLMMVVALVVAHIGRAQSKKAPSDQARFRRAAIWYTVAVLIILAAIPWPFMPAGRPWIRLG